VHSSLNNLEQAPALTTSDGGDPAMTTTNLAKLVATKALLERTTQNMLKEKLPKSDEFSNVFWRFGKAAIAYASAVLVVGAVLMIHSKVTYGTHKFWSGEAKATKAVVDRMHSQTELADNC